MTLPDDMDSEGELRQIAKDDPELFVEIFLSSGERESAKDLIRDAIRLSSSRGINILRILNQHGRAVEERNGIEIEFEEHTLEAIDQQSPSNLELIPEK